MGRPEEKTPLGTPRPRLGDNIKMGFLGVGLGFVNLMILVQNRDRWRCPPPVPVLNVVNAVMKLRVS